jgi:hypothetical protein
MEGIVVVPMS